MAKQERRITVQMYKLPKKRKTEIFTLRKLPIVSGKYSKEFLEMEKRSSLTSCPTATLYSI